MKSYDLQEESGLEALAGLERALSGELPWNEGVPATCLGPSRGREAKKSESKTAAKRLACGLAAECLAPMLCSAPASGSS